MESTVVGNELAASLYGKHFLRGEIGRGVARGKMRRWGIFTIGVGYAAG